MVKLSAPMIPCGKIRYLEKLGLIVAGVNGILISARVREELAPIHFEWTQTEGAIGVLLVFSMLPLYNALRTSWIRS